MEWWQTLIVALATYSVTKSIDLWVSIKSEKREFKKLRRELCLKDIEQIKDEVGIIYELASNWRHFQEKQTAYIQYFESDHELIGRVHKYPIIVQATRQLLHWCKVTANEEQDASREVIIHKEELAKKHKLFLEQCEKVLESL
jgi:hypothetical protein